MRAIIGALGLLALAYHSATAQDIIADKRMRTAYCLGYFMSLTAQPCTFANCELLQRESKTRLQRYVLYLSATQSASDFGDLGVGSARTQGKITGDRCLNPTQPELSCVSACMQRMLMSRNPPADAFQPCDHECMPMMCAKATSNCAN
jgi:hypothetical protein